MSNKNEVFEYLIDQLRRQVNSNQCEDLAHEVQSLKNQLRDARAQIKELHLALVQATGDVEAYKLIRKGGYGSEQSGCCDAAAQVEKSWIEHTGAACPVLDDTVVDIKFRNGEVESNTKALWWSWRTNGGPYEIVGYRVVKQGHGPEQSGCRKEDTQECAHEWCFYDGGALMMCRICGLKSPGRQKEDVRGCEHEWRVATFYGARVSPTYCRKCGLKK